MARSLVVMYLNGDADSQQQGTSGRHSFGSSSPTARNSKDAAQVPKPNDLRYHRAMTSSVRRRR